MLPNPVLKRLGFADNDRLVIIHTDDIGMCQASVQAFADLWEFGTISSGAVMVPCPWAKTAAQYCRDHPEVDMGVHATLTSEWENYRWGPLSTRDFGSGLLDTDGFFHQTTLGVHQNVDPDSVLVELTLQIQRAHDWGIDITHIDTHMGSVLHPRLAPAYIQAGLSNKIPMMIPRWNTDSIMMMGAGPEDAEEFKNFISMLEEQGIPLIDHLRSMPLDQPEGQVELAKQLLSNLPPGITHFILHPCIDTPEIRMIADDWQSRVSNYNAFMSKEVKDLIDNRGLNIIGYRRLRELL
jgi:hypothetical protein